MARKSVTITNVAAKPTNIPDVLSGKEFDAAVQEAIKVVRNQMYNEFKLLDVEELDDKVTVKIFGNRLQVVIDRSEKSVRVSNLSSRPFAFFAPSWITNCNLFLTHQAIDPNINREIKTRLHNEVLKAGMVPSHRHHQVISKLEISDSENSEGNFTFNADRYWREFLRQNVVLQKATNKVQNTCWGRNRKWKNLPKIIGGTIWQYLDKEIAGYAIKMGGQKTTFTDYNRVWNNLDEIRKVASHSPGLLPVWKKLETWKMTQGTGETPIVSPNIVEDCKRYLDNRTPITKRAWKYLLKMEPLWVRYLLDTSFNNSLMPYDESALLMPYDGFSREHQSQDKPIPNSILSFNSLLDFLADVNRPTRFTACFRLTRYIVGRKHTPTLVSFVRSMFDHCKSKRLRIKEFLNTDFMHTWDWYKNAGVEFLNQHPEHPDANLARKRSTRTLLDPYLDPNQMKAKWAWFMRQQESWHQRVADDEKLKVANVRWYSLIKETTISGYEVIPLASSHDLFDEGKAMKHCVKTYSDACESGASRIFSIRKDGKRLSTLEIANRGLSKSRTFDHALLEKDDESLRNSYVGSADNWSISQHKGPCNAQVSPELSDVANKVKDMYQKRWEKLLKKKVSQEDSEQIRESSFHEEYEDATCGLVG